MSIQKKFEKFCSNIKLTKKQRLDAKTKYSGVCKTLHNYFYQDIDYNRKTKFLFGSYRKHTAIRPLSQDQDVDVLFKIPEEIYKKYKDYQNGGQSALLQEVRKVLIDSRYGLGEKPKAWGKVILVKTKDGTHNIELLPAYEKEDKTFIIPNSENGGSWDIFNPRVQIEKFKASNKKNKGLTRNLSRIIKRWALETTSVSLKSFQIENLVISFLDSYSYANKYYSQIVKDFFENLLKIIDKENRSYVETAKNRVEKAIKFELEKKEEESALEWKKIFGDSFPLEIKKKTTRETIKSISELEKQYPSKEEEFLEKDYGISFTTNQSYQIKINARVTQNGFRPDWLSNFINKRYPLKKGKSLLFFIEKNDVQPPYSVYWKIRNFGNEAKKANGLRGEITLDQGHGNKKETTKYNGEHYAECYIVKNGVCVARSGILVPIGNQYEQ